MPIHHFTCPVTKGLDVSFSFGSNYDPSWRMATTRTWHLGALMRGQVLRYAKSLAKRKGLEFRYEEGPGFLSSDVTMQVVGEGFDCVNWCWEMDRV